MHFVFNKPHFIHLTSQVLKERETEIAALESSIQASQSIVSSQIVPINGHADNLPLVKEEQEHDAVSTRSTDDTKLSADTMDQFVELRKSIGQQLPLEGSEDDSLGRLDELMRYDTCNPICYILCSSFPTRSMAQKESAHREIVDSLNDEMGQLRRQHDELTALSRDQVCP